jgi:hypothetical protein
MIRRRIRKEKTPDSLDLNKKMIGIFMDIWRQRKHVCYETGESLGKEPLTIYFHHVLPKHKYPEYMLAPWNIVLVSVETHDQVERDIDKCPKIKKLFLELLEKHRNFVGNL